MGGYGFSQGGAGEQGGPEGGLLARVDSPADVRTLSHDELGALAAEIRSFVVNAVSATGGHLGSNLGVVELTLALHRVFDSPQDAILWDTGHQAYVHKIVTGRKDRFGGLRQAGGMSGYPSRAESEHDWVENSHASTILSYAHGLATSRRLTGQPGQVVAVIGDGALTGGMAYEALNNLGHSGCPVLIVLNDNGRSYAPTVSRLSTRLTRLRASRGYVDRRQRVERVLRGVPKAGPYLCAGFQAVKIGIRHALLNQKRFFEALGVRYIGPIDGHDIAEMERVLSRLRDLDGPLVLHVVTDKGAGYEFAERDVEKRLHDAGAFDPRTGPAKGASKPKGYTAAFSSAVIHAAERDDRVVAITAAMPGPTGLLPFQDRFPNRYFDVGIAEQHAVTAAAGMAMGGLRPIVAVYSTFLTRAVDQVNLDVGLHGLPVVFCLDRAGITGDDGPSHHGVLDMVLLTKVPGMTVLAPSSAQELEAMLAHALTMDGPVAIRYPKGDAPDAVEVGSGLAGRRVRQGRDLCIIAVGRMLQTALEAAELLAADGVAATVWDARAVKPLDPAMIADAARHPAVITVEDGMAEGGAGTAIAALLGQFDPAIPVTVLGTPTSFIPHGNVSRILANLGLDGPGVAAAALKTARAATTQAHPVPRTEATPE